ncbi:MAG: class I SAM-dependent methyltransferase [Holophagaceae bacterium]|nr:class I SAM-dependent methyltransferase [Holophagaceae bacterium]
MSATERFDKAASTWDLVDRRVLIARGVTSAIPGRIPLSKGLSVLDFGCGTGLVTMALGPQVGSITGADTSRGMLDTLAVKAKSAGFPVHLRQLEVDGSADLGGPYDLIVSSMTLHHVADVPALFRQFEHALAQGGHVALADLDKEDGTFHEDTTGVYHQGFDRGQIQAWLAGAGFQEIHLETATVTSKESKNYPVFLATALRG